MLASSGPLLQVCLCALCKRALCHALALLVGKDGGDESGGLIANLGMQKLHT